MVHSPLPPVSAGGSPGAPTVLVAAVDTAQDADRAIADGADMIDASGLTEPAFAAIRARHPSARPWTGTPAAMDADQLAAGPCEPGEPRPPGPPRQAPVAAVVATAAIMTWLGVPAVRTRHVMAVRRAIDMTGSIAGTRPPALTTRGLA